MLRKKKHDSRFSRKVKIEHSQFYPYLQRFLEHRLVRGFSEQTNHRFDSVLRRFIAWSEEHQYQHPQDITRQILEAFQRHLFYQRKPDGQPLAVSSQVTMLSTIQVFFKWLAKQDHILYNPASELELPKRHKNLPRSMLSEDDVKTLMNQPDIDTPEGTRDRAMLELFYSCGIRRHELAALLLEHLDLQRLVLIVKRGKGNKERRLPVGDCAAQWLEKYVNNVRDELLDDVTERALFLTDYGAPFSHNQVGQQVKKYLKQAEIEVTGSCHLLRHAMATHMLERGADIRFIQAMLGHEDLNTTEIYTKVSVEKLREVHTATHPATIPVNEANTEKS